MLSGIGDALRTIFETIAGALLVEEAEHEVRRTRCMCVRRPAHDRRYRVHTGQCCWRIVVGVESDSPRSDLGRT